MVTTALDVTIQAQILDLMISLKKKRCTILLITHDLAVIAGTCDGVIVMYGGKVREIATVEELFKKPLQKLLWIQYLKWIKKLND